MIYLSHYETVSTTEYTPITDIDYPQNVHLLPDTFKRAKTGLFYPPHETFKQVITSKALEYVKNNPVKGKTAFLLAAGSQGWAGTSGRYDNNTEALLHYKTKIPFITLTNIYAGRVASMFEVHDHVSTDATACASSLKVLMDMQNLMFYYGFDRAIVLAGEDATSISSLEFFGDAKANITLEEEQERQPSAFDNVNYGFRVGQGAALMVFEKDPKVNPHAKFLGAYTSAENNMNPLGQTENGEGYAKAIEGALLVAKVSKDDVKLVKTHGTGTPVNNAAEKAALNRTLSEFIATSYKPRIGHTLSASGLLETGLLLNDLKTGVVPRILNKTEDDSVFISKDTHAPEGVILSLAAGMGNAYSAALFDREV